MMRFHIQRDPGSKAIQGVLFNNGNVVLDTGSNYANMTALRDVFPDATIVYHLDSERASPFRAVVNRCPAP